MKSDANDRLQSLMRRLRPPETPPSARLRASPERSNVRVLVLIGVVAALVAAGYLWLARPRPVPPPAAKATLAGTQGSSPPPASASAPVVVHVFGKVEKPGVVTLPSGSRVAEAIEAAGGVRKGGDTGALNLARELVDGEQIPVGVPHPTPPPGAPAAAPGASASPGTPLDLNTATLEQLDDLPGVGPVLARRIIDYRTEHGGFRSVEQLQDVSGIGARRFADLKPLVRV